MPHINSRARLAGQLRRTLDAVIPLVEGKSGRASLARAELEIASLRDIVVAMKKQAPQTNAPRVSRGRTSRFGEERLSLH
jgi:hypothetical protein